MSNVREAKAKMPLPQLMIALGDKNHVRRSARCPFHHDKHNSFSVFPGKSGGWFWKCHASCGAGDGVDYLKVKFNLSTGNAIRRYCDLAGVSRHSNP